MPSVRNAWPVIIDALRADRKMIAAETLGDAEVESVQGDVIVLRPLGANPLTAETIGRYRSAIEAAASRVLGGAARVAVSGEPLPEPSAAPPSRAVTPQAGPGAEGPAPRSPLPEAAAAGPRASQRVTVSGAKAERTKALRGRDPALDSAMDALDLELLE